METTQTNRTRKHAWIRACAFLALVQTASLVRAQTVLEYQIDWQQTARDALAVAANAFESELERNGHRVQRSESADAITFVIEPVLSDSLY